MAPSAAHIPETLPGFGPGSVFRRPQAGEISVFRETASVGPRRQQMADEAEVSADEAEAASEERVARFRTIVSEDARCQQMANEAKVSADEAKAASEERVARFKANQEVYVSPTETCFKAPPPFAEGKRPPTSKAEGWSPADISAPPERVTRMSTSAASKGNAEVSGTPGQMKSSLLLPRHQSVKEEGSRKSSARHLERTLEEQQQPAKAPPPLAPVPESESAFKAPPPMPPIPVSSQQSTNAIKPKAKPPVPQPPSSVERFEGPLGVCLSSGSPQIPALVPPAVSPPPGEVSESKQEEVDESAWSEVRNQVNDLGRLVQTATSSSAALVRAEEDLACLTIASQSSLGAENVDRPIANNSPQLFNIFTRDELSLTMDCTQQSLATVNDNEEPGSNVHIELDANEKS